MAEALLLDPQIVRQDMKMLMGKDRVSEEDRKALFATIARLNEIRNVKSVVLVGVGKLGLALMGYAGFSVYDLDILAGFDINPKVDKKRRLR
jgi:redox-sensing transcriptional repressor